VAEGRRVFSDATQNSQSGCKKLGKHGSRKGAVRRARYLAPRTSRWLSADPALSDYIPLAPVNDEAKKHNQNLPGMGGVFNVVNFHLYHYAGNNPVKYTDPTGMFSYDESGQSGIIEYGDTLSQIVKDYNKNNGTNFSVDDVAQANNITDVNKIYAGDTLSFNQDSTKEPTLIPLEQNSPLAILEVPDITQKTGGYDIVAGAELIGLGASLATAGGIAGSETIAAIGAGTISAGAAVTGAATTGFFVFLGGAIIFMGIDLMSGDGLDRTENLINKFLKKED